MFKKMGANDLHPNKGIQYKRDQLSRDGGHYNESPSYTSFVKSPKSFLSSHLLKASDNDFESNQNLYESQ